MYLAVKHINGKAHYFIRQSYQQGEYLLSRDLMSLGTDPGQYIVYPGGNSFYIDPSIEDQLADLGTETDQQELEDIFWRFVDPEIRSALDYFRGRQPPRATVRRPKAEAEKFAAGVHIFDKRRIHFLKFGQVDQGKVGNLPASVLRILDGKSRDEIEQKFMEMEAALPPREYKTYVYVIFNLQNFFYESYAAGAPQMLEQDRLDSHFIEQVCLLNDDRRFWAGMQAQTRLNDYLVRYVQMYFDYEFAAASWMEDYLRQFINSRRDYRPPFKTGAALFKEASSVFGETQEILKAMDRRQLIRLYRRKAQQLHPDKGGRQDQFVKLTQAYREMLKTKR